VNVDFIFKFIEILLYAGLSLSDGLSTGLPALGIIVLNELLKRVTLGTFNQKELLEVSLIQSVRDYLVQINNRSF
jgi:hypothetical protein